MFFSFVSGIPSFQLFNCIFKFEMMLKLSKDSAGTTPNDFDK